jgi:hypothetical protein
LSRMPAGRRSDVSRLPRPPCDMRATNYPFCSCFQMSLSYCFFRFCFLLKDSGQTLSLKLANHYGV